nr:hypothetical protein [Tanacetum cinerariifolium]
MATIIEQQVALDEALVPSTQRLWIGRSNFRLPSDIQSKESTLQLVYDVLCRCPFFKAFLVTADVPEIYMQEFCATAYVHQRSIRFKMNNKKHIMDQESFREMLHICPRIPGQAFAELPFKEEILEFIRYTKAYKEYYAFATGEAAPKPKASAIRKKSGSDTSITPPTATTTPTITVAVTPRLTAAAKGKQPVKTKRTSLKPRVPDVPTDELEEELSWNSSDDEGADDEEKVSDDEEGDEGNDSEEGEEDDDDEDKNGKSDKEDDNEETRDEESFDPIPRTPKSSEDEGNGKEDQGLRINEEERLNEEEEAEELYRDVNINQGRGIQATLDVEDSYMILNPVHPDGQQESSSVSSQFVTSMVNPPSDAGMESIFATASSSVAPLQTSTPIMTQSTIATITTISHAPITPTTIPSEVLQNLPTFESVFRFEVRLKSLEANFSKYIQTNPFAEAVSNILGIVHQYMNQQMTEAEEGPSAGSDRGSKSWREGKEPKSASTLLETATRSACMSTTGSKSRQVSASESAFAEEPVRTTYQMDEPSYLMFETGITQTWISELAKQTDSRSSFNELLDTPLELSNFIMNRLRVDTLTPKLLARPTYELMKGSYTSLIELEYHLEEPLSLIPDNRGRRVIPFAHFINNDLEYLRGGAFNRKYTTFVTKTKATDYGNIKWIKDLVPRTMWIQEPINYDKHALWGVSHWGRKRQQFYRFTVNQESALDIYSKRRIITVMDLKIMEWHSYKHLDWITVRHDDDKLYKFKESNFKRLRLQDIEDMLLLLVQGKLSNLTVEDRFAFNVSLRMFTRSIVIQRRVEDLQLGVKSYQKRLNLTKPDTYRSDLKRREAYTAYSNPRGFIYQNKDKKNRLMRIDELHKFSDETLNDVKRELFSDNEKLLKCKPFDIYIKHFDRYFSMFWKECD